MKALFSFLLLTAIACIPLTAQYNNCPGPSGPVAPVDFVPPSDLGVVRSPLNTDLSSNSTFGGQMLDYSDISAFNGAASSQLERSYSEIQGSPFLSEEFLKGTVITTNGLVITNVPLKFNLHTQEFVSKSKMDTDILLDERQYSEIILPYDGREISFKRVNSEKPSVFYEVLFENAEVTVYKEYYATIKEATSNGISSTSKKFSQRERFFVMQENGLAEKTRLKKKTLLALLPSDMAREMEHYANVNDIDFRSEADFIRLFTGFADQQNLAGKQP